MGGFRASLYNALPIESVKVLVEAMRDFWKQPVENILYESIDSHREAVLGFLLRQRLPKQLRLPAIPPVFLEKYKSVAELHAALADADALIVRSGIIDAAAVAAALSFA